jgi:hypothetical protein
MKSSPRKYPRTDLPVLCPWNTFEQDIHEIILNAMARAGVHIGTQLSVGDNVSQAAQVIVANEEDIRQYANTKLHRAAQGVLAALGFQGGFMRSAASEIIGDPDFAWVFEVTEHPKGVVCLRNI